MGIQGNFSIRQYYCGAIFTALFVTLYCSAFAHEPARDKPSRQPLLVDTGWLQARRDAPDVVVVDTRLPVEYARGHIAGAVSLPSTDTFRDELGKRVAPQPGIEYLLSRHGIRHDDHLILYGYDNYRDAARVLWILTLAGLFLCIVAASVRGNSQVLPVTGTRYETCD